MKEGIVMNNPSSTHDGSGIAPRRHLISVPGRTEVAGNHQDHQGGCVLASAIDKRTYCEIYETSEHVIRVISEGYDEFCIDLTESNWWKPRESERYQAIALVRGMAAQLRQHDVEMRGCTLEIRSEIPSGMGLSSSAAFELCIGASLLALDGWTIDDKDTSAHLLVASTDKKVTPLNLAQMALHAERAFFGKPCGIMDQISCAYGGVIHMDFTNRVSPVVKRVTLPPSTKEYVYFLVDCGQSHEDETDSFAQVAIDMQTAADAFGVTELRELSMGDYISGIDRIRELYGDLVALRGLAFFEELNLVKQRMEALDADDAQRFVELTNRSGLVSAEHLHNVGFPGVHEGTMVALALCHAILDELSERSGLPRGSARIHGGGFGGTIQVIVPKEDAPLFKEYVSGILGPDTCMLMNLGAAGVCIHGDE